MSIISRSEIKAILMQKLGDSSSLENFDERLDNAANALFCEIAARKPLQSVAATPPERHYYRYVGHADGTHLPLGQNDVLLTEEEVERREAKGAIYVRVM